MASPYGHALTGVAVALLVGGSRTKAPHLWVAATCAVVPDADFLPGILLGDPSRYHHGVSHSLLAAAFVAWGAARATAHRGWDRRDLWIFFAAAASHPLVDAVTEDPSGIPGVPLLWPLSSERLIAPVWLFPAVRRDWPPDLALVRYSLWVALVETALLVPLVLGLARRAGRDPGPSEP